MKILESVFLFVGLLVVAEALIRYVIREIFVQVSCCAVYIAITCVLHFHFNHRDGRIPLGKVKRDSYVWSMPRVLEGLKHRYGRAASKQVSDGPEPLHNYLDVSLLLRSLPDNLGYQC